MKSTCIKLTSMYLYSFHLFGFPVYRQAGIIPVKSKLYYYETHMIEFKHKHVMNIILNHVWFHHTIKIKIIL